MAIFKGLIKACEHCAAPFKVPRSHAHVRTCSTECGYKVRKVANVKPKVTLECVHCRKVFTERQCHADRRAHCSYECAHADEANKQAKSKAITADKNPSWKGGVSIPSVSASGRRYNRQALDVESAKGARRRARKSQATPSWADHAAIRAFYREAARLTKETGTPHHVDHIVPLKGDLVSGLHTHTNLQVLVAQANLSKSNRFAP